MKGASEEIALPKVEDEPTGSTDGGGRILAEIERFAGVSAVSRAKIAQIPP